ncbi:hypothetical protein AXE65_12430 [Ventosimonas gracilis]|uniref:HTH cro/C1-type domain-containing protein n=1 Tax=Ventosimonas gracilis TaxID=1680762 RepID=A0A139SVT7_9GAMM|nr:LexA family transcriptional regulator [Ventosimonas gracilis]KXU38693.1 hypothetical protein AXE65_12430 [Ventosimonas gracilis]
MEKLGARIAHYRKSKGLSQAELAKACGWSSQSRVGNYEKNTREPSLDDLKKLADVLGIPLPALIEEQDSAINNVRAVEMQSQRYYRYPLISSVNAGTGNEVWECWMPEHAEEWLYSTENAGKRGYWLTVDGHSMTATTSPSFPEGTRILVQSESFSVINGKFYIAQNRDGETTFKRYQRDSGKDYLMPLNPDFRPIDMDKDGWHIIGRVLDIKLPTGTL